MAVLDEFRKIAPSMRVLNVQVYKDGELIEKADWDTEIRRNQYSASKSFTSAAVGIAVKEGLLELSEKVVDAFSCELPENPSEYLQMLTVRDLLTMCTGQAESQLMGEQRPLIGEQNWVKHALSKPFKAAPNTEFLYNNTGPYLAGMLVQRRAGCNLVDYLMPRMFQPLSIRLPTWEADPLGNTFGAGGLFLTVSEVAKFSQLYLQGGFWNGRQIFTQQWGRESTGKQVENNRDGHGYGYLFWPGPENSFRCDGKYGQYGIVLPQRNAVIALNAECREQDKLVSAIYEMIVPAI